VHFRHRQLLAWVVVEAMCASDGVKGIVFEGKSSAVRLDQLQATLSRETALLAAPQHPVAQINAPYVSIGEALQDTSCNGSKS